MFKVTNVSGMSKVYWICSQVRILRVLQINKNRKDGVYLEKKYDFQSESTKKGSPKTPWATLKWFWKTILSVVCLQKFSSQQYKEP